MVLLLEYFGECTDRSIIVSQLHIFYVLLFYNTLIFDPTLLSFGKGSFLCLVHLHSHFHLISPCSLCDIGGNPWFFCKSFVVCVYIVCLSRAPLKICFTEWTPWLKITITIFNYAKLITQFFFKVGLSFISLLSLTQISNQQKAFLFGMLFVTKLFTAMGDRYFKSQLGFLQNWFSFLHNQVSFFTEPILFLFRANSIALQSWLGYFTKPTLFFFQNQIIFFTKPSRFFGWAELFFFCIIKQGTCPQPAIHSCKSTGGFTHARLLRM